MSVWRNSSIGFSAALAAMLGAIGGSDVGPVVAADPPAKYERAVLIRLEGTVTPLLDQFLHRKLDDAQRQGADLVIVEIDSPGGLVESSFNMAYRLRDLNWAATVAYVPREALSGAAIVALGCERIIMHPNAVLGDAGPIVMGEDFLFRHAPEKIRSDLARKIRDLAETHGRPPALAEAMVDMNLVVYQVTDRDTGAVTFMSEHEIEAASKPDRWIKGPPVLESREDSFLEVNGRRAVELGLADATTQSRQELQALLGLTALPRVIEASAVDTAVYVLNWPSVTALLFIVGLVALYVELSTPGIGLGGLVSLLCFGLFFWSRFLGGTAELLEVVLFLIGVAFLAVEIFVLPGFGIAGISGLLLMFAGVVMASQTFLIPETRLQWETFGTSVLVLGCSAVAFLAIATILSRHFGSLPILNGLVLQPAGAASGAPAPDGLNASSVPPASDENPWGVRVGDSGVALSPLRPAGKARFDASYLDVLTDGDFVERGRPVRIVEIQGSRIVVREDEEA